MNKANEALAEAIRFGMFSEGGPMHVSSRIRSHWNSVAEMMEKHPETGPGKPLQRWIEKNPELAKDLANLKSEDIKEFKTRGALWVAVMAQPEDSPISRLARRGRLQGDNPIVFDL